MVPWKPSPRPWASKRDFPTPERRAPHRRSHREVRSQRVLGGLTVINAAMMPDGTIQQSQVRINITAIGELDGRSSSRCTAIKTAMEAGGVPIQVTENILVMMWEKFFGFACSATIASLSRSRAGVIARAANGASFVSAVIDECTRVATAIGYPPIPALNTAGQITGLFSQTGSTYGPSILIDMEDGRPTEGRAYCRRPCRTRSAGGYQRAASCRRPMQSPGLRTQPH